MKVESAGARGSVPRRRIRKRSWFGSAAGVAALVASLAFAGLSSEDWQRRLIDMTGAPTSELAVRSALSAPARFARALFSAERAPVLKLDIKFKHLHKIHEKRDAALAAGVLLDSPYDFVPATIQADGRSVRVELRLVAADSAELLGSRWPLRVHVKRGGSVFGMRRFTLLAPAVRGFQAEPLFLEHLRREDVLAPRYLFVETVFNGKHLGLMAVEEAPSAALLENQERRDGVILHLIAPPGYVTAGAGAGKGRGVEILPARGKRVTGSKKLSRNLETASRRLRAFLEGDLDASVVFDTEAMGRFLAVVESWGAFRALSWSNLRFYFNPLTARLEPVGFAGETQREGFAEHGVRDTAFGQLLLGTPDIEAAYAAALSRGHLERSAGAPLTVSEQRLLGLLQREFPMRGALQPALAEAGAQRARRSLARIAAASPPVKPSPPSEPWPMQKAIIPARSVEENLRRHSFLRWDPAANELRVRRGRWAVDGSILLPAGVGLRIPAGVVLSFEADRGLIARGPLNFEGTAEAPVVLEGPPGGKRKKLWSGVYLLESAAPSRWSHVHVRNTGGFKRRGWQLPGGVVFRKTHVDLEHCRFSVNRSDDSLNLVRSSFSMRDVSIRFAESDALDLDYSRGSIEGGSIQGAGGDGIDLGGSELALQGMRLSELHDKAIVVGERSRLDASRVVIDKADIGLASKNGSKAELRDSRLRNIGRVALLAYTNRSEFGPGVLIATGNQIQGAARIALSELDSQIIVDGERVLGEAISIASLEDLAGSDR